MNGLFVKYLKNPLLTVIPASLILVPNPVQNALVKIGLVANEFFVASAKAFILCQPPLSALPIAPRAALICGILALSGVVKKLLNPLPKFIRVGYADSKARPSLSNPWLNFGILDKLPVIPPNPPAEILLILVPIFLKTGILPICFPIAVPNGPLKNVLDFKNAVANTEPNPKYKNPFGPKVACNWKNKLFVI